MHEHGPAVAETAFLRRAAQRAQGRLADPVHPARGCRIAGRAVALLEGWPLLDGIYFGFVTSLTIGYGDLVPHRLISRVFAIGIGLLALLLIALVAAIAVRAMEGTSRHRREG